MGPEAIGTGVTRKQVFAWGLWDWGSAAFNAVIVTFVFSVYPVSYTHLTLPTIYSV